MIKRAQHHLAIDFLDEEGAGVGQVAGRLLHVPFALPGEQIVAELEHQSPHTADPWGSLVERITTSSDRVEPECAAWGRCGGCALQHLGYRAQLEYKRGQVVQGLSRAGISTHVEPCVAVHGDQAPRPYRNRSKLVFARTGERIVLGAYAPRSHRVIDLGGCRAVIAPLDAVAASIARLATELGVRPYDERSGDGDARYAILRAAPDGATQVMLVVARRNGHGIAELARRLAEEQPLVRGVVENLQAARGNALVGHAEPDVVLHGEPDLEVRLGAWLRFSPRAFSQASWSGAERLYRTAVQRAELGAGEVLLDLYCGVGGIALAAALSAPNASVIGVEESADSIADAEAGRARNGIDKARFVCDGVAKFTSERSRDKRSDVVIVDPPRKGLEAGVVESLGRLAPRRIVYVSCAPDTLARDLALLSARGYHTTSVAPFDLMPDTPHVETLAQLDRE